MDVELNIKDLSDRVAEAGVGDDRERSVASAERLILSLALLTLQTENPEVDVCQYVHRAELQAFGQPTP